MPGADISVLIPTYGRPRELQRCLTALTRQTMAPAAVVVVTRDDDAASRAVAASFEAQLALRVVSVQRPGQVQALNRGLAAVATSLVAITDDDACPRPEWLQRIVGHFADPTVGAVGGRDVVHQDGDVVVEGRARAVGRVTWFGRVIGNHHLDGVLQDVQFLKGANMSYRRETLAGFDENLAGDGSQICNDMQASLRAHTAGWRVVWDPRVAVDHYPAARLDDDDRVTPTLRAVANTLHNQTYIVLSLLCGWRRATALVYSFLVGTRLAPGVTLLPLALLTSRSARRSLFGFRANLEGRTRGLGTYLATGGRPRFSSELAQRHQTRCAPLPPAR